MRKRDKSTSKMIIAAAAAVILNSLILLRLGVGWGLQGALAVAALIFILAGLVLFGRRLRTIPDVIMIMILAFIVGLIVFTALNFLLLHFHRPLLTVGINCGVFVVFPLAAFAKRGELFKLPATIAVGRTSLLLILVLALLLSLTTAYGFRNDLRGRASRTRIVSWSFLLDGEAPVPNWGWNKDKGYWLGGFIDDIRREGLPGDNMLHNGVQVFFLSLSRLFAAGPSPVIRVYKATAFLFFFSLLYGFAYLGKRFFGLKKFAALLLILSVPFFAAVNYPFVPLGRSSYLGFFPAGGTFFHSVTQFMSLVIGIGGIVLILEGRDKTGLSAGGCLLAAAAFFFKPSFFAVTALPFAAVLWVNRIENRKNKIIGTLVLIFPAFFWKIYPAIFRIPKLEVPLALDPFRVMFHYAFRHFSPSIYGNDYLFASLIVVFSFAVFIPAGIYYLFGRDRIDWGTFFPDWRKHLPALFLTGCFLIGVIPYALLIQDSPQMFHANLSWGAGIGYLLFLPLLVKLITGIKSPWWKTAAGFLFALHLWGGIYHLYRFTVLGMIY